MPDAAGYVRRCVEWASDPDERRAQRERLARVMAGGLKMADTAPHAAMLMPAFDQLVREWNEQAEGLRNLARSGWRVDYVASHCLPSSVQDQFSSGLYTHDSLTDYFDVVRCCCRFNAWFCGHYHRDACYLEQFHVCYRRVLRADSAQWQDAAAL